MGILPLVVQGQQNEVNPSSSKFFILFKKNAKDKDISMAMEDLNAIELWQHEPTGVRLWEVQNQDNSDVDGEVTDLDERLARSRRKTRIDQVVLDGEFQIETSVDARLVRSRRKTQIDDFAEAMFGGHNLDWMQSIDLSSSQPIRVAILDSGVSGAVIGQAYGYGHIFEYSGYDYVNNDLDPNDEHGHGTKIAGLMLGVLDELGATANVTFDIRKTHDKNGLGSISNVVTAIIDAVDAGADVINMSFSYYEDKLKQELKKTKEFNPLNIAIEYAAQHGVLVVAAAGNESSNIDSDKSKPVPAALPNENLIAVASNDIDGQLSAFSNYGLQNTDVSILGEEISGYNLLGDEVFTSGSSFSTAIVSAFAAILGVTQPSFDAYAIKCQLMETSPTTDALKSKVGAGGMIDINQALSTPFSAHCGTSSSLGLSETTGAWEATTQFNHDLNQPAALKTMLLYPNPAQHSLQVNLDAFSNQQVQVAIFDTAGKLIFQQSTHSQETNDLSIDIRHWHSGLYTVTIKSENNTPISKKVVITK